MNVRIEALEKIAEEKEIPLTSSMKKIIQRTQNPEEIEKIATSVKVITQELNEKTENEKIQYEKEYVIGPEEEELFQIAKEAPLTEDEADDLKDLTYHLLIKNFVFCPKCDDRTYKKGSVLNWGIYQPICSNCQESVLMEDNVKHYSALTEIVNEEDCNCGIFKPVKNTDEIHKKMGRLLEDIVL